MARVSALPWCVENMILWSNSASFRNNKNIVIDYDSKVPLPTCQFQAQIISTKY